MMSSNMLGNAIAPMIGTPLLVLLGWRHTFLALGIAGLLLVLILGYYFKPPNNRKQVKEDKNAGKVPVSKLFKTALIRNFMLMWFGAGMVNWGLSMWSPTYLIEARGIDMASFGFIAAIPSFFGAFASVIAGWFLEKFLVNREKYFAAVSMGLLGVCLYMFFSSATLLGVVIFMSLSTMFAGSMLATVFSMPHKWLPEKLIGTAMGTINIGGQLAGIVAPTVMGILVSLGGFNLAFSFLIGAVLFSGGIALTINKKDVVQMESESDLEVIN